MQGEKDLFSCDTEEASFRFQGKNKQGMPRIKQKRVRYVIGNMGMVGKVEKTTNELDKKTAGRRLGVGIQHPSFN